MWPCSISGKGQIPYQIFLWNVQFSCQQFFRTPRNSLPVSIIKAELKHDELLHLHFKCKENMLKKIRNFGQSKYWWKDTGREI